MDEQEGYADGLAGAGKQERQSAWRNDALVAWQYERGFLNGSLDRKTMLAQRERKSA